MGKNNWEWDLEDAEKFSMLAQETLVRIVSESPTPLAALLVLRGVFFQSQKLLDVFREYSLELTGKLGSFENLVEEIDKLFLDSQEEGLESDRDG